MRFIPYSQHNQTYIIPESLAGKSFEEMDSFPISQLSNFTIPPLVKEYNYSPRLQQFLQGKELLLEEIPFSISLLHEHYLNGYISYHKGIISKDDSYQCVRCGNDNSFLFASFFCARCKEECVYCRKCIQLGRVSQCSPLIRWQGPVRTEKQSDQIVTWKGELSLYQQKAAKKVIEAIRAGESLLIWAVCGSGKTEMLFEGIAFALQNGKKVLLATPRTDVVLELSPRLKQVFPKTKILTLYGGSEDRLKDGQLIISTTHQLFRFYQAFDIVIIDEVDAFPYSYDESLAYAVSKAKKEKAPIIYLSATPTPSMQKQVAAKNLLCVKVPRRYHGYPLPVPIFKWCGNWRRSIKKHKIPKQVMKWILATLKQNKPIFLFVPSVAFQEQVTNILKKEGVSCSGVHAEDQDRLEKVMLFRQGKIPLLVTTTILERGVTIPNVQVAVLGADDDIFTESALVQIAGRVGRKKDYPNGEAIFFHFGVTVEMRKAVKHIISMNEAAK